MKNRKPGEGKRRGGVKDREHEQQNTGTKAENEGGVCVGGTASLHIFGNNYT